MTIHVSLPAQFAEMAGGVEEIAVEGRTVGAVLETLAARHPPFRGLLWARDGRLNPVVVYFVNGQQVKAGDPAAAPLRDGDELMLISAVEGG